MLILAVIEFLELCGCGLELLDLFVVGADLFSLGASRENRRERRRAKRQGEPRRPRSAWTWAFLILTPVAVVLTALVLWRWASRPG